MSNGDLLIQPLVIDPADFPTLPLQPGFAQLVSDELADAGTPSDGFDDVLAEAIGIVDAMDAALGSLAGDLLDAFVEADTIDAQPVSDTADGFTASLAPTSTAVDNLGTILAGAAAPTPAPGPSGGGGGTPTTPVCDFTLIFGVNDALPTTQSVNFVNFLSVDMHISSKTLTQDVAGTFSETDAIPATLSPGATYAIHVTYAQAAALGTSGKLTIVSDAPTSPHTLCFSLGASDASVGSSGGAGGPAPIHPRGPSPL